MDEVIEKLQGKTILITGATGLIGRNLISFLSNVNKSCENPIKIFALVRNIEKAKRQIKKDDNIKLIIGDVVNKVIVDSEIDYIIHAASQTSSKMFVNEPVQTIETAFQGTKNILDLARRNKVKSMIYLSTMEVYGAPTTDEKISESHETNINTMEVRSSYPESKRMCETLCCSYYAEYNLPVKVVRLTQTFGCGVDYNDGRVFAEFARCVIEGKDIVLHTKGETKRNYLDVMDAVTAILTVLLKGENGQAYNVANEETYCSILEMAKLVTEKCAGNKISIHVQIEDGNKFGYAPTLKMNLDTLKLKKLGWKPEKGLEDMFYSMIEDMQRKKNENRNN